MKRYNKLMDGSRILLGAHRGDRANYPENTMPAFISAVEMGCDAIETDVRMTKDGRLVLIHDRDVVRTTNGNGFVDEMTLEEIQALEAGFWKGDEFIGVKVPTVEEFLEYVGKTDVIVNWELKEYPNDLGDRVYLLIDKLVALLEKYDMVEKSMMNSFSEKVLEYCYDKYPGKFVIHGYIKYKYPKDFADKPLESFLDWAAMWRKDDDHPASFKEDYDYAIEREILTCILVKDTVEQYKTALDFGCKMFTSDDPKTAIEVLKTLGKR